MRIVRMILAASIVALVAAPVGAALACEAHNHAKENAKSKMQAGSAQKNALERHAAKLKHTEGQAMRYSPITQGQIADAARNLAASR